MQKWEYLAVRRDPGEGGRYVAHRVNGQELPNWEKGPSIYEYFNQLGEQGWEMFAKEDQAYYFKRPKE